MSILCLSAVLTVIGEVLIRQHAAGGLGQAQQTTTLVVLLVAGLALIGAALVFGDDAQPLALALGIGLAAVSAMSVPVHDIAAAREPFAPTFPIITIVALLPPTGLAAACTTAEFGVGPVSWKVVIIGGSIASIPISALLSTLVSARRESLPTDLRWVCPGLIGFGFLLFIVPHALDLDEFSTAVGAVGSVALFGIAAVSLLAGVDLRAGSPPSAAMATVRFRRFPLLLSLVALVAATSFFNTEPGFHRARTVETDQAIVASPLEEGLNRWREATKCAENDTDCTEDTVPMFLIATAGGGGRAAYWQLVVYDCLFNGQAPAGASETGQNECAGGAAVPPALASGISGGSVGLAMTASRDGGVVDERDVFATGFLDAVVGNLLYTDIPNSVLHWPSWRDRAAALEEQWEDALDGMSTPLFAKQGGLTEFPLIMLNSATVEEGCRMNVSVLDLSGAGLSASCRTLESSSSPLAASRDVVDFLSNECTNASADIALSTAALLSARFPFVSPSGALVTCVEDAGVADGKRDVATYLVDGGYIDSSGASTLAELLPLIATWAESMNDSPSSTHNQGRDREETASYPCIQPVVIQIDNGYADITAREVSRPQELLAPLIGFASAGGGRADATRQELAILAGQLRDVGCNTHGLFTYLHLYPEAHPGVEAPLGWALSLTAQRDLEAQLYTSNNREVIESVKSWLAQTAASDADVAD